MLAEKLARRHIMSQDTQYVHVQYGCGGLRVYSGRAPVSGFFFAWLAAGNKRVVNGWRLPKRLLVSGLQELEQKQDHEHLDSSRGFPVVD